MLAQWAERTGADEPVDLALFDAVGDPDFALDALDRLATAAPDLSGRLLADPAWARRVVAVLGGSTVLAQVNNTNLVGTA